MEIGNNFVNILERYTLGSFQKAYSLSGWHQPHEKLYRKRYETNSLKLKIIQHCKQHCKQKSTISSLDSPSDEIFRTPNSTLDADDSALEKFSTPIGDFSMMKMKSMNNLFDDTLSLNSETLSRMKSLSQIEQEVGDTPVDLVKLKRDFVKKRFNDAKMRSINNLLNGDDSIDSMISRRHHCDNGSESDLDRHSLPPTKFYKRIGNTKYVGGDHFEDRNYQIMKIKSMGTIDDIMNNTMKKSKSYDPFYNINGTIKKNDKKFVGTIQVDEKLAETNGKDDNDFKIPDTMLALKKENSSSCIETMKTHGSTLYGRLR